MWGFNIALPTAAERDTPTLGNALLQWRDATEGSARSFRMNRFLSRRVAGAIGHFAAAVKNVSASKALTLAFYGCKCSSSFASSWKKPQKKLLHQTCSI